MNSTKKGLCPSLRFPEFKDSGDWEEKKLEEIAEVVASGDLDADDFSPFFSEEYDKPIYSNAIENEGLYGFCKNSKYKKNSITITARGNLGIAFYRTKDFTSIGRLIVAKNFENSNPVFVKEFWNHAVKIPQEVTCIPQLTAISAKNITIALPTLPEQQKIADCLSSLDELINGEIKKLEAYKLHKKGMMQKLFPAEGRSVPEYRFPEFRDSGDWEENTLGKILIKNSIKNKDSKITLVQSVSNKYGFINQYDYFEDRIVASNDTSNYYIITKGCFAYNPSRIDVGSLAYKCNNEISIISPLYVSFKADNNKIVDIFLLNWFFSNNFKSQMIFEGGVRNTLNYENLREIKISIPQKLEQQKIAACLSSLDELISEQAKKIESLKVHKKGLMQGLFPSLEDGE